MTKEIFNVDDVADYLGCQPGTVEDRWRAGSLPGFKIGTSWQVPKTALDQGLHMLAMANMRCFEPPPPAPAAPAANIPRSAPNLRLVKKRASTLPLPPPGLQ